MLKHIGCLHGVTDQPSQCPPFCYLDEYRCYYNVGERILRDDALRTVTKMMIEHEHNEVAKIQGFKGGSFAKSGEELFGKAIECLMRNRVQTRGCLEDCAGQGGLVESGQPQRIAA